MLKKLTFIVPLLILAAGCSHTPPLVSNDHLVVTGASELPAPVGANGEPQRYAIGPFDTLLIDVFNVPELDQEVQTDANGRISMPMLGEIQAGGRTPGELAIAIEQGLRQHSVRDPQVGVNLKEIRSHLVTVDGQVAEPGRYPVIGDMTLMGAVAVAKGATEFAKVQDVVVFRTVGDQQMAALYNLGAIRRGIYEDPRIYANDVVVVGESAARKRFRDILQAAPLLVTPIVALLQTQALQ